MSLDTGNDSLVFSGSYKKVDSNNYKKDNFEFLRIKYKCLEKADFYPKNINIPDNFEGIKSLDEFVIKFSNKNGKLYHYYYRLYDFLCRINEKVHNGVDPVKYLYYLYFDLEISAQNINKALGFYGNYSEGYINKIFTHTFGWKIRSDNVEHCNTITRKEDDVKKVKKFNSEQNRWKLENVAKVEKILKRISKNKEKTQFLPEVYNSLKNVRTRARYILEINGYISEEIFYENLIKLSDKYGMKVTAQAITNILEQETSKIGNINKIELRAGRIREIKNEYEI